MLLSSSSLPNLETMQNNHNPPGIPLLGLEGVVLAKFLKLKILLLLSVDHCSIKGTVACEF